MYRIEEYYFQRISGTIRIRGIDPADTEGILQIPDVGEGPRLAYIGTARTAPRKDSDP